jgi:hypothetical protein
MVIYTVRFQSNNYTPLPLRRKVVKEDKTSSAAGG